MMDSRRGVTLIELIVGVICIVVIVIFLWPTTSRHRNLSLLVRCLSNLQQIGQAASLYADRLGGKEMYPVPAGSFRGDAWLASLYWSGMLKDPKILICPQADDHGILPARPPKDLASADAVAPDAVSYAGLCHGLSGPLAHRNTRLFMKAAISPSCVLACDDNENRQNHIPHFCVVFFDLSSMAISFDSVDGPKTGSKAETYDSIGVKGSPYEHLDSGE